MHFGYGRIWAAPVGTPLTGPGWTEIGQAHDAPVFIDDLPQTGPPIRWPTTVIITTDRRTGLARVICDDGTPRSRRRLAKEIARFDRDALAIRWPGASRVKREYHRRRR
jgi:hypothetical protein